MTKRLLNLREAAAELEIAHATLCAMAMRGEVPFIEIPSSGGRRRGRIMFKPEDIDASVARWRVERAS